MLSDNATNSHSVLDLVTIPCFLLPQKIAPMSPRVITEPVCDFPSTCTPYDASTYCSIVIPFTPGFSTMAAPFVCMYPNTLFSLAMSSTVLFVTLVVRYDTATRHSGLVLLAKYSSFATLVWKSRISFASSSSLSPQTSNKLSVAGVAARLYVLSLSNSACSNPGIDISHMPGSVKSNTMPR